MEFRYDLHLHSCLSPCGDNDSTPFNIVGMAVINGLHICALTDHNTVRNCPAFFAAAAQYGIIPIAGMELTTAEDIHMVCLFEHLEDALRFDTAVDAQRIRIPNRTDIFGEQWLCGEDDTLLSQDPDLLSVATQLPLEDAVALAEQYGGLCYPAHIDRQSNGIIATLGMLPPTPVFSCVEFHDAANIAAYTERYGLAGKAVVVCSDAHVLWDISDGANTVELDATPEDADAVRRCLFAYLRGEGVK